MTRNDEALLDVGRKMIFSEAQALLTIASSLGEDFMSAVTMLLECRGKIILTGMGKSGYVAACPRCSCILPRRHMATLVSLLMVMSSWRYRTRVRRMRLWMLHALSGGVVMVLLP